MKGWQRAIAGFSLIECLVALLISAVGLMGMIALQGRTQQVQYATMERAHAMLLIDDIVSRMSANLTARDCYAVSGIVHSAPASTPTAVAFPARSNDLYLGAGATASTDCFGIGGTYDPNGTQTGDATTRAQAQADLLAWSAALQGDQATLGTAGTLRNAGGLKNARGCIVRYDPDQSPTTGARDGPVRYQVMISWQGLSSATTAMPDLDRDDAIKLPLGGLDQPLLCANSQYTNEDATAVENAARRRAFGVWVELGNYG